ncbi:MAG: hypothetical protein JNJ48_01250 [Phycisphaerae bacterium]|nr:hypothetical protein [Phycisphaerae bacterium]
MFSKICFLVLVIGASACVLLSVRQQRLDAVHDMAVIQQRIAEHDRDLLRVRAAVAARLIPSRIETLALQLGPLTPIGVDPVSPLARPATAVAAAARAAEPASRPAPARAARR